MNSRPRSLARLCVTACAAATALSLAACGGSSSPKKHTAAPSTPATTSSSATPAPKPAPAAAVNPLTGLTPSTNGVVIVKIDDTANGRPPVNLAAADIVFVEQVEGGLTRMMAVYNSSLPVVEPVRSTRANDPELAVEFGRVAYVASGGAPNPLAVLRHSPLLTSINDAGGPGFSRDPNRPVPYNLVANLAQVAAALHPPRAKSVGFVWSGSTAGLAGTPVASQIRTVVGATPVGFNWDARTNRYDRIVDGAPLRQSDGKIISTPNVIVQFCTVTPYPADVDVAGHVAQFTKTVGRGMVVVFRNGHAVTGVWGRATPSAGTTLMDSHGHAIALAPGGAWVILAASGAPLSY